jgi:hypothetical protein
MKKSLIGLSLLALGLAGGAYAAETMPDGDPLGDKTVTKAEFQAKGAAMFDKMDANHDGKLDAADRAAHEGQMFDRTDANHDGALSRDEVAAAHPGHDGDGAAPDAMRAGKHGDMHDGHGGGMMMMHMADTNKDGAVSREEFLAAHNQHFDMMDANHDGQLTQPERKAAREKMHAMGGMRHGKRGDHPTGDMPPPPPAN